jgi:hypothetical protein
MKAEMTKSQQLELARLLEVPATVQYPALNAVEYKRNGIDHEEHRVNQWTTHS